ncbi:hypothetical protein AWM71_06750 [Aerococcus christensenii]|nr:hypothetical protein AWM71_06750 [Aerococcus christensenii]
MAQRRMFSKKITESDQFLDMSLSAQCLYFHINMAADDEGFVGNVKTIKRMIGASDDDLKILIGKEFLIPFKTGVVVIRDWKIHNYIQKDRYSSTFYSYEKAMLATTPNKQYQIKKENCIQNVSKTDTEYPERIQSGYKVDTECIQSVSKVYPKRIQNIQQESENEGDNSLETASNKQCEDLYPNCIQNVSKTDTQVRLGKVSIELGKNSIELGKNNIELGKNSIDQLRSDKDIDKDIERDSNIYINKDIDINKYIVREKAKEENERNNVQDDRNIVQKCYIEKEIEKEKEKDKNIEIEKEPVDFELDEDIRTYAQICKRYPSEEDREKAFSKLLERGRDYLSGNWEPKSEGAKE